MSDANSGHDPLPVETPPPAHPRADVPVFNCHVYVSRPDAAGQVTARLASLPEFVAVGQSERDALRSLVQAFKLAAAGYVARGEQIPWRPEPLPIESGEQPRWVPVHL
jgi:hypothetical protein